MSGVQWCWLWQLGKLLVCKPKRKEKRVAGYLGPPLPPPALIHITLLLTATLPDKLPLNNTDDTSPMTGVGAEQVFIVQHRINRQ